MYNLKKCCLCGFAICLLSCNLREPSRIGETAPCYSEKWTATEPFPQPVCPPAPSCLPLDAQPWGPGELIDIALQNNPQTKQSWQLARAAAFNMRASESTLYPSINFQDTLNFTKVSSVLTQTTGTNASSITPGANNVNNTGGSVSNNRNVSLPGYNQTRVDNLTVSYLMLDAGGRIATIEAARQALLIANWMHNRTIQTVIVNVLDSYYNYVGAQALLEAKRQDLHDAEVNLDAAQQLFSAGLQTIVGVLQAESSYVNAELQLETVKGQVNTALGQLATALGLPANAVFTVAKLPETLPTDQISEDMDALMEIAKTERPDLAAAYHTYLQAKEQITVVNSAGWPIITANANVQNTVFIHNPSFNNQYYNGNLMLSVPIFSGFLYRNQTLQARANASAAFDNWQNTENNIFLQVVTNYYAYKTAVSTLKYSEEYLKYAQEAYDATLATYKNGTGTFLDVLVAQGVLANARAQRVQAKTQLVTSVANLAYATGTL